MPTPETTETILTTETVRPWLGGEWVEGAGPVREVRDPADSRRVVARVELADRGQLEEAIARAREAAPAWGATTPLQRGPLLERAAVQLAGRAEEVARTMTEEMGKVIAEARAEVARAVAVLRYFAEAPKIVAGTTFPLGDARESAFTLRVPLGVVGLITPWNFPLAIPTWKTAAALAYGNVVILKPAGDAPLSARALVECLGEAGVPSGVLSFLPGAGSEIGDGLVESASIDGISFTGSTAVGLSIADRLGGRGRPVQCEMGGRNAIVVMADADLDAATAAIVAAGFGTSGQRCTSSSRVIVERPVAAEMRDRLLDAARALRVGPGLEPTSEVGPLVSAGQRQEVLDSLERARGEGVDVICGGEALEEGDLAHGNFVAPAVTVGGEGGWFAGHEVFGPVISLYEADDFEHAVRLNNTVEFGLSSGIFTTNLANAMRFVHETDTGMVHVNRPTTGAEPHVPFGGAKSSSVGPPEMGGAREFFTHNRSAHVRW
jgi:acyl-CoA reductase-like NAD-dependent aldehyde dehydrogenase